MIIYDNIGICLFVGGVGGLFEMFVFCIVVVMGIFYDIEEFF